MNTPGGYECFCQPGFLFDGVSCFDLDEVSRADGLTPLTTPALFQCMIGNPCVNGNCTNKEGGYSCDCHTGYLEEEGVCLDVNEVW